MNQNTSKSVIKKIIVDNNEITQAEEIANQFNNYFCNVASELERDIPDPVSDPIENVTVNSINSMCVIPVFIDELQQIVDNLKNSFYGIDRTPVFAFKRAFPIISDVLLMLINKSFCDGVFPECLKIAEVVPVHKSGPKTGVGNFRPISVLPLFGKLIEKCISVRQELPVFLPVSLDLEKTKVL